MSYFDNPTPHLFAHRGGNGAGKIKENTLAAFDSAVKLGYKFLETDVIVTKDDTVIAYHGAQNSFMKSIYGLEVRSKVQKLTYKQANQRISRDGNPIPKFKELLKKFDKIAFCVDVKTDEVVEPLVALIKELNAEKRVVITSFSMKRTERANRLLYGDKFDRACLCIYRTKGRMISLFPKTALKYLKSSGFSYLHIPHICVNKRLINVASKLDFKLYAWTVNEKDRMKKLIDDGIAGIISDESALLLEVANEYKNSKN